MSTPPMVKEIIHKCAAIEVQSKKEEHTRGALVVFVSEREKYIICIYFFFKRRQHFLDQLA